VTEIKPGSQNGVPPELGAFLQATDDVAQEKAWAAFIDRYNRILLHTIHSHARDYDGAMDRYAFVLERLREDDFARLRRFVGTGTAKFTTWFVVVARRLCVDYQRRAYGRQPSGGDAERAFTSSFAIRRRLADLVCEELDLSRFSDSRVTSPEMRLRETELHGSLEKAIQRLAPRDRLLLKLRFQDGLSAREIAELTERPSPFHVYREVKSVLGSLRESLLERGVRSSRP